MRLEKDKRNKNEVMVLVTMQVSVFMTDDEVDMGVEIPHETMVTACINKLANRDYSKEEEEL